MSAGLQNFAERAAAVFSALGNDGAGGSLWTVSTRSQGQSVEPDAISGNSSDEGGSPKAPPPLLSWGQVTEGEDNDNVCEEPSSAFRQAFELEFEADEFDIMAAETLTQDGGRAEPKPDKSMEVLPDNPWDRICEIRSLREGSDKAKTREVSSRATLTAAESCGDPSQCTYLETHKRTTGDRRSGKKRQRCSPLPDFVKHPEKYIHYELDEPIVVGGGCVSFQKQLRGVGLKEDPQAGQVVPELGDGVLFHTTESSMRRRRQVLASPGSRKPSIPIICSEEAFEGVELECKWPGDGSLSHAQESKTEENKPQFRKRTARNRHYRNNRS